MTMANEARGGFIFGLAGALSGTAATAAVGMTIGRPWVTLTACALMGVFTLASAVVSNTTLGTRKDARKIAAGFASGLFIAAAAGYAAYTADDTPALPKTSVNTSCQGPNLLS